MADQLFRFPCVRCGVRLKAQPVFAGKSIVCPKCKTRQFIPQPASSEEEVDLSSAEMRKLEMYPPAGAKRPPVGPPLVPMPPSKAAAPEADPRTAAELAVQKSGSAKVPPPLKAPPRQKSPPPLPATAVKPPPLNKPPPLPQTTRMGESARDERSRAAPTPQPPPLPILQPEASPPPVPTVVLAEPAEEGLEILDLDDAEIVKEPKKPEAADEGGDWFELIDDEP